MAGGINEIGSYRDISLIRSGKIIDTLDVYDILINGKYNFSNGLRSGDSILVNPAKKLVSLESGVMRPSTYELKEGEKFQDLLKFANGFAKNNDFKNIVVKRVADGKSEVIYLTLDELNKLTMVDNDSIFIREFKVDTVQIQGSVNNPGTYKLNRGTTLSEAITIAGGYDSSAYPFGSYLENKNALEINKNSKDRLYQAFVSNLLTNGLSSNSASGAESLILQLNQVEPTGRIIAEFDLDLIESDPSLDTILENGDRLLIPQITQQVYVQGEVANPGAIRYRPGMDINYYLNKSGGVLRNGDIDNLFIVHPNGETENLKNKSRLSFIIAENDKQLIYPGSIIYIPQDTNFLNPVQTASIWAPIISSMALSLTSLSVLNSNN
jgi:protein involved in polysaccharide export with SLBB domain